ncbi:MAG: hypothetical protein COV91_00260 [Candidatus Taylorbacteria bacterium CG11_big_fil_rev_8_21_14_0_20_46_11]|uniref:Uncharacterized protein n=1 Tax=Candidatus Taylorbacteria bacterium CG11_big_fil_rev_8_21_14_0_20_46_11 TaxID=1975025 RepID=A0A2H0KFI6_9BACT|nr:MAG: hypothetical protein COV91_00260 [Candidatus Taylorbacteria bacterium CG11_big_fil_rev_8_21_14_0_20_46_11]
MYVKVHVTTESKTEQVHKEAPDYFTVSVREPAKQGLANARVLELLRKHFGTAKRLYIVSGHHSPHKIISIDFTS